MSSHDLAPPVLRHTVFSLTARASMLAGRGLGLILISRQLGSEQFGLYALLLATYNIFVSLGAFGIEQTNLYLVGRRPQRGSMLVGNSLLLAIGLGTLAAGLCFATIVLLRGQLFTDASPSAIWITALGLPIGIAHSACIGLVIGLGRFRYYGLIEMAKWAAYLALIGVLTWQGKLGVATALGSFFVVAGCAVVVHLLVFTLAWRMPPRPSQRLLLPTLGLGKSMLMVQLSSVLLLRLDVYAVRLFGSSAMVGAYALAAQLGEILMYAARSLALVVFSGTAQGAQPARLRLRPLAAVLVAAALVLCVGSLSVREDLLVAIFGETARGCVAPLLMRMPGVLSAALALLFAGELLGRGRAGLVVRANSFAVILLVVYAWPFARWDVMVGAAAAFTIAHIMQVFMITSAVRMSRKARARSTGSTAPVSGHWVASE